MTKIIVELTCVDNVHCNGCQYLNFDDDPKRYMNHKCYLFNKKIKEDLRRLPECLKVTVNEMACGLYK